jgi:hypothetical protein
MAKTICTLLGAVLLLVGIVGFVAPGFLGTHLSLVHNLIHIVSGAAALYLGLSGSLSAARTFCLAFGAVYLLLGVVGFFLGGAGTPSMPNMAADTHLFKVIPGVLELGTMDHCIHLLLGIVFLAGGLLTKDYATTSRD